MQAFAWFSDLLVEHAEIFWSLFAVDMDRVLAEQNPDTWDSFPLFQILNNYLATDGKILSKQKKQKLQVINFTKDYNQFSFLNNFLQLLLLRTSSHQQLLYEFYFDFR